MDQALLLTLALPLATTLRVQLPLASVLVMVTATLLALLGAWPLAFTPPEPSSLAVTDIGELLEVAALQCVKRSNAVAELPEPSWPVAVTQYGAQAAVCTSGLGDWKLYAPPLTVAVPLDTDAPHVPSACTGAKVTLTEATPFDAMPVAVGCGSVDGFGETSTVIVGTLASTVITSVVVLTLPSASLAVSDTQYVPAGTGVVGQGAAEKPAALEVTSSVAMGEPLQLAPA